jgi:hypothetical protein
MVDPQALMWPQLWRGEDGQANQRLLLLAPSCAAGRNQQSHLTLPQQATLQKKKWNPARRTRNDKGGKLSLEGCHKKENLAKEISDKLGKNERQKSSTKEDFTKD